jgi:hypothetical protein
MSALIIVRRKWSLVDLLKAKLKSAEDPGRKIGKPKGSYLDDLVSLRKSIVFCVGCERKFDHRRHKYSKPTGVPYWQGDCDVCREFCQTAAFFVPNENMTKLFAKT